MHTELTQLQQIRLDEGLSFRALAERVGISHHVLHNSIRQRTEPSEVSLYRMREFLKARARAKARAARRRGQA